MRATAQTARFGNFRTGASVGEVIVASSDLRTWCFAHLGRWSQFPFADDAHDPGRAWIASAAPRSCRTCHVFGSNRAATGTSHPHCAPVAALDSVPRYKVNPLPGQRMEGTTA